MFLKGTCESEAEAGHRASGQQKDSKPYGRSARGTTKVAWQGRPQRKDQSQHASIEHLQGHTRSTSHKETAAQAMNYIYISTHAGPPGSWECHNRGSHLSETKHAAPRKDHWESHGERSREA